MFSQAIRNFDKAIEIDPKSSEAYVNKGNALDNQEFYDLAIESFDKAIELSPDWAEAYLNKGNSLYAQGY